MRNGNSPPEIGSSLINLLASCVTVSCPLTLAVVGVGMPTRTVLPSACRALENDTPFKLGMPFKLNPDGIQSSIARLFRTKSETSLGRNANCTLKIRSPYLPMAKSAGVFNTAFAGSSFT